MRVDQRHWRLRPEEGDLEAAFAVEVLGWWVRVGLFVGEAPGSHMMGRNFAWWRTRSGSLDGVNVRFGWWPEPCVTLLVHTRPAR